MQLTLKRTSSLLLGNDRPKNQLNIHKSHSKWWV
jgi:hypothetical protein